ncbi:MAG: ATP-binding protein [Arenicella sp.]
MNLQKRVLLTLLGLTIGQGCILLVFTFSYIEDILNNQIGQRALNVAESIAQIKEVSTAIQQQNSAYLQPLSLGIAEKTGARFVVIGDKKGVRLSHPVEERIGLPMQGGDNDQALVDGKAYVSQAVGSLGPSMRGKAPIKDSQGNIVGIVSVGYMLDTVADTVRSYQQKALLYIALVLFSTAMVALYISRQIRESIHGLEPEEIARLFAEQSTTLESIKESIISTDALGNITTINKSALDFLGLQSSAGITSQYLLDIIPNDELLKIINTKQAIHDHEVLINNQLVVMNQTPLYIDNEFSGAVTSFRLKGELEKISEKLSIVEQQADSLRSQAHEYSNRLQTLSGLITLNETDKALELIGQEHYSQQELITLLVESINSSLLSGFIIGKYNRAKELGLTLEVDKDSEISGIPEHVNRERLITIVGNLVENALEASLKHSGKGAVVRISMNDLGNDLIFEIEDQGPGIPDKDINDIFAKGTSSKDAKEHGYGLWLVKEQLQQCQGYLTIDTLEPSGSLFTVFIPKRPTG